jgi:hypothetical protein
MKARDLREALAALPDDAEVVFAHCRHVLQDALRRIRP